MAPDSEPKTMQRHQTVPVRTLTGAHVMTEGYRVYFCEKCYLFMLELWMDAHCDGWRT